MSTIIAIDGPAGAGKSTVAKAVARALGLVRVDTGAIYRAVALSASRQGLEAEDAIAEAAADLALRFEGERVLLAEEDVSDAIRTPEMSQGASKVSALPKVRAALLELQRRIAREAPKGAVLEGRDIGTVVFPDADLKIFLTATPEERARRRTEELGSRGTPQDYQSVLDEMKERDHRDANRAVAPLKPAEDAVEIDSTRYTIEEVVTQICERARALTP